jgi:hypothetical protein
VTHGRDPGGQEEHAGASRQEQNRVVANEVERCALRTRSITHPARAAEDAPRQRTITAVASTEWRARQRR